MECFGLNCFAWIAIVILTLCLLFRQFKKKIFAFLLARTSKNPILDKHKKKLFSPLNEAAQKAGNRKLKVNLILTQSNKSSFCNFTILHAVSLMLTKMKVNPVVTHLSIFLVTEQSTQLIT